MENYSEEKINKISQNKYVLESIRINLLYNDYYVYLCDKKYLTEKIENNYTWREYDDKYLNRLTNANINIRKTKFNMLQQIYAIENNNSQFICKKHIYDIINPIIIFSKENIEADNNLIKIENKLSVSNFMLGVESIKMLEHQDLERFCDYFTSTKTEINKSLLIFGNFYNYYLSLTNEMKERLIIISGMISYSLGTTYTSNYY